MIEEGSVKCPVKGCKAQILEIEYRPLFKPDKWEELQNLLNLELVRKNSSLIQCSCGNILEIMPGKVDYNEKTEDGKAISRISAQHKANKNRIRRNKCTENFCVRCSCRPYHLGKTCEENQKYKAARKCRFCTEMITNPPIVAKPAFKDVCRKKGCVDLMNQSCDKEHPCGHYCVGFAGEKSCLPCLNEDCVKKNPDLTHAQTADDYCSICYTSGLGEMPVVQLQCSHLFHLECLQNKIKKKWPGPRIVFSFLECFTCKQRMKAAHCPKLAAALHEVEVFEEQVVTMALERAKHEEIHKHDRLKQKGDRFYNNLKAYSMYKLSYYMCFKCKKPYFGGMKDCEQGQEDAGSYKLEDLVCGKCAAVSVGAGIKNCKKHGIDFIEFKCRFCCSIVQWFCWGTTHFCEPCHKRQVQGDHLSKIAQKDLPKCKGSGKCSLKMDHPANGEDYGLGCALCRNLSANQRNF